MNASKIRARESPENASWTLPPHLVQAAAAVMGGIDLDPLPAPKQRDHCAACFTTLEDALGFPWHGRVWLRPPFDRYIVPALVEKLIYEFTTGRVEQAVVLTNNSTDTLWFHRLEEIAARLCFTRGRIRFVDDDGSVPAMASGQAFFYLGCEGERFAEIFAAIGCVRPRSSTGLP